MTLELIFPRSEFKDEYFGMMDEFEQAGETYWFYAEARKDFAAFLRKTADSAQGKHLPYNFVPFHTFWLVRDETHILGELRLRHRLTDMLAIEGGHIGYNIRPSERRKGYGTQQLGLGLEKARALGLARVLVTCDDDNLPSAKIIEANGGELSGKAISMQSGALVRQYWIDI